MQENYDKVHPKNRKKKYPTAEDFWNMEEELGEFRIYSTRYSENRRFRRWLRRIVSNFYLINIQTASTYEAHKNEKIELVQDDYLDYNHKMQPNFEPGVLKYNSEFFLEEGEKQENPVTPFSTHKNLIYLRIS